MFSYWSISQSHWTCYSWYRLINHSSSSLAASYGAYPICKGCSVCSRDNGCVNCQPKLFLFLRRERMRQYGECLHDCPAGYYGMRSPEINMCSSKNPHPSPRTLPYLQSRHAGLEHTPTSASRFPTVLDLPSIIKRRHTYLTIWTVCLSAQVDVSEASS